MYLLDFDNFWIFELVLKQIIYPLIVQPLAPYMVLVRHIFTTLQYTFKTLPELFPRNKYVIFIFY